MRTIIIIFDKASLYWSLPIPHHPPGLMHTTFCNLPGNPSSGTLVLSEQEQQATRRCALHVCSNCQFRHRGMYKNGATRIAIISIHVIAWLPDVIYSSDIQSALNLIRICRNSHAADQHGKRQEPKQPVVVLPVDSPKTRKETGRIGTGALRICAPKWTKTGGSDQWLWRLQL